MNKTAIVTGAASGIGLELARVIAQDGIHLLLVDIREDELLSTQQLFQKKHPELRIEAIVMDLTEADAARRLFAYTQERHIEIDILINNAGIGSHGKFSESNWERESQILHIHVNTLSHLIKLFIPGMVLRGKGKIMNVSSLTAFWPGPFNAVYFASKAYILSLSEALSNEVKGTGVTVTVLCPGITRTNFQNSTNTEEQALYNNNFLAASAEEVARFGYNAMKKGRTIAIPRLINRILAFAPRFVPRNLMTRIVRKGQEVNRRSSQ